MKTEDLLNLINSILKIDKERLISRPEWGNINFKEANSLADEIFDNLDLFKDLPIDKLPLNVLKNLINELRQVQSILNAINGYSVEEYGNSQVAQLTAKLEQYWNKFYTSLFPHIGTLINLSDGKTNKVKELDSYAENTYSELENKKNSVNEVYKESEKLLSSMKAEKDTLSDKINNEAQNLSTKIQEKINEAKEILATAKEVASEASAASFSNFYNRQSILQLVYSGIWTFVAFLFALTTLYISGLFIGLFNILPFLTCPLVLDSDGGEIENWCLITEYDHTISTWYEALPRIAFIGIMIGATAWCARIARAHMHQQTLYKHRSISMQTLETFYKSAVDPTAKDTVVVEAAKAAFGNVPTGFIGNHDNQSGNSEMKILGLTREISKTT